ncbi:MAG: type 2 lanthipeptide synthetase LanM [Caldilineaceae bacterium]
MLDATSTATFVLQARTLGEQLAGLAHRYQEHAVWIGLGLDAHETWSLAPLTMHLYDGHAGLAFFFAYLEKVTGEAHYRELAEAALATTLVQADGLTHFTYIGGFSGWGGIIYTLAHLGACWQRPDLWQKAEHFVAIAASHVAQDEQFDVIGGAAGCIGAAAALYACTKDNATLALIDRCAAHLAAHAHAMETGVGWVVPNMGGNPLAGFSHGASGIAWALLQAADLCANEEYRALAQQALDYEQSLYVPTAENWRDLRDEGGSATSDDATKFMHAWCHGAPGIGLSRLAMLAHSDDPQLAVDLAAALRSTEREGFGRGHCLCHGDLGNLDLFVSAAHKQNNQPLLQKASELTQGILADHAARGWLCGVPGGVETPGLMVGLAGIGYEFLRLAAPDLVPSVLLMEAPPL